MQRKEMDWYLLARGLVGLLREGVSKRLFVSLSFRTGHKRIKFYLMQGSDGWHKDRHFVARSMQDSSI
jgi:hypothetical protein